MRNTARFAFLAALALASILPRALGQAEPMSERTLRQIVGRQKALLAEAASEGDKLDSESFRVQVQALCSDYEILLRNSPNFAAAYASYGYLLSKLDMPKEAVAIMLKANQLDPNIPLVKNQIGNFLAEEDKPLEAENYYMAAIKLDPDEPLYHYQLGTLLYEARDEFIKSGNWTREQVDDGSYKAYMEAIKLNPDEPLYYYQLGTLLYELRDDFIRNGSWTREQIDDASHKAFARAAELAPNRIEFTYRYAESFNDLDQPDWDKALKAWAALEEKEPSVIGREILRLQAANVLIKQGNFDGARVLLATVTEPKLAGQKQKLVAQLPENAKK